MKRILVSVSLIIILSIISVVLTGCGGSTGNIYRTGTDGLVFDFSKANANNVYEGDIFGTALFIRNQGSADILTGNPATLKVSYDDYRLEGQRSASSIDPTQQAVFALHGKNAEYPKGEDEYFAYYFKARSLTKLRESSKTSLSYSLCYPYNTVLTTFTCIDTKSVTRDESAAACTVSEYSGNSGQGAPIVISKIEPQIMLSGNFIKPYYNVYVRNAGGGYVTNSQNCEATDINNNLQVNKVNIRAVLSGTPLKCGIATGDNDGSIVKLIDGEGMIRCQVESDSFLKNQKNFEAPLTITLEYTYVQIARQEVEIKSNPLKEEPVTQGACNSYQVEYPTGTCVTKCEYCSEHPDDMLNCQENIITKGFDFTGFSCSCTSEQCNERDDYGNCIKGYCPGNLYCCSNTKQCDAYQIMLNGKCIDKCEYCAEINPLDTDVCQKGFNFNEFSCMELTEEQCNNYAEVGGCVKGYCGGENINSYCANIDKRTCPTSDDPGAVINYGGECITWCEYCAIDGENDDTCKALNRNNQLTTINSSFSCGCTGVNIGNIFNRSIIADSRFCTAGVYCCDTTARTDLARVQPPDLSRYNSGTPPVNITKIDLNTIPCPSDVPLRKNGECVEVCDWCSKNPNDADCNSIEQSNSGIYRDFTIAYTCKAGYDVGRCFASNTYCKFGPSVGMYCCDDVECGAGHPYYFYSKNPDRMSNNPCHDLCDYCWEYKSTITSSTNPSYDQCSANCQAWASE